MQRLVPQSSQKLQSFLLKNSANLRASSLSRSLKLASTPLVSNPKSNLVLNKIQTVQPINLTPKRFYASSLPEHTKVVLPALSPTMEQGTLAKWAKKEGDHVLEGDLIAEIETDKATMGLEATDEGYLAKILVQEKTRDLPLKTLLCIMVKDKSEIAAFADYKPDSAPAAAAPKPTPAPAPAPAAPVQSTPPPPPPPAPITTVSKPKTDGRIFATPLARKLAAERNIDLSLVEGSGPDKQIRAKDVENYVVSAPVPKAQVQQQQLTAQQAKQDYEDLTINNYRAVTAKRLTQSKQTIPHYYLTVDVNLDNALKVRQDLNEQLAKDNVKLSVNDLVIKAAALACKKVPEANSAWMDTFIRK